jgi:hypothetical protein
MFRYPHISLTEAERALIVRTVAGSELELKFGYGGQTGLPEALYASIVSRLERHARKEEPVTYTNTMWPAENGTYRKTSGPEGDVYIKKVRLSRPETTFQAEFAWFTLKCSESEELPIRPLPLPDAVTTRRITRTRFSAPITIGSASIDLVYECSVVQTSKGGGTSRSFEIEMELPEIAETPDAAISGVSYLLAAFYEPYGVPPSFLVPKYEEMQRAIETVNESTSSRSRDSFRFRSNPVNLKREEIGRLDEFAMTNKLDGERKVVVSHPSGVWVFHPSGWIPGKIQSCYLLADRSHLPFFVLDTEYYEGRFHVFDVIQWGLSPKHQFMTVEGHEKRMNQLSPHLVDLERLHLVRKKFYYGSFRENIGAFMAANDPGQWYDHNDGLIFTPKNGTWAKPPSLKYKFPAKLSIDFRLRLLGEHHHQNVYELGVAKYERGEKAIVPLDGMTLTTFRVIRQPIIGECVFSHEDRRWIVLRDRTDKTDPNEIKVAGNVHDDIRNPITFAELAGGVDATIAEREAGFLYESAKKEQRLFAMGFDLLRTKLVGNLMAFYRNSDEKTGRDLDERLFHFFHQPYSLDFDIMHYLTEKMGDRYTVYGDLREVALLQTILGKRGVREVFDGRTQMVVNASALAQLSGVSYRHPLARMIIPGDDLPNPMSVVRFPELGSVLSGWFPELRRMAIMKAHGIEELSAWRASVRTRSDRCVRERGGAVPADGRPPGRFGVPGAVLGGAEIRNGISLGHSEIRFEGALPPLSRHGARPGKKRAERDDETSRTGDLSYGRGARSGWLPDREVRAGGLRRGEAARGRPDLANQRLEPGAGDDREAGIAVVAAVRRPLRPAVHAHDGTAGRRRARAEEADAGDDGGGSDELPPHAVHGTPVETDPAGRPQKPKQGGSDTGEPKSFPPRTGMRYGTRRRKSSRTSRESKSSEFKSSESKSNRTAPESKRRRRQRARRTTVARCESTTIRKRRS